MGPGITEPSMFILAHQFRRVSSENSGADTDPAKFLRAAVAQVANTIQAAAARYLRHPRKHLTAFGFEAGFAAEHFATH